MALLRRLRFSKVATRILTGFIFLIVFTSYARTHSGTTVADDDHGDSGSELWRHSVSDQDNNETIGECYTNGMTVDGIFELILADEYERMDPSLPKSIRSLKERGAHRCWHKHSTFLQHLLGVHNILRLWGQGQTIGRVGLFHSAYSNSYVNLALYDPLTERQTMKDLIGDRAEGLVHLFCIINRQEVVVNTLLKSGAIPREGIHVPHLRNKNDTVYLSPETLRLLVVFTMADIADQYFGWQDQLFGGGGSRGSMIIPGRDDQTLHNPGAIWPGVSKPGLWMSYVSQLAAVAHTFELSASELNPLEKHSEQRSLDYPPVFNSGTVTLSLENETLSRDLYWSAVSSEIKDPKEILSTVQSCISINPWAFEPYVISAQILLQMNEHTQAEEYAGKALSLQKEWGTAWDKRLSFEAWVSWTRVLYQRARDQSGWPVNSWDVNNFGLVQ